jgi:glutathione S-transferase
MIKLYYHPGNASLTPHVLLNEIGAAFELVHIDCDKGEQRSLEFLRINPHGRVPTLVHDDLVLYETAAIVLHLVERFPEAGLAPPPGTDERSLFYRWIAHFSSTIQPEMRPYFYSEQHTGDQARVADVKMTADKRLRAMFEAVDAQLGRGPWLLGDRYSAADPYLTMLVRWTRNMSRPARTLPHLAAHAERVLARPQVKLTFERELKSPPFI